MSITYGQLAPGFTAVDPFFSTLIFNMDVLLIVLSLFRFVVLASLVVVD
jgi:hypothetical protein